MQDVSKDNKLNAIQYDTKLVIGDNLLPNMRLVGENFVRTKSIINGGSVLIDVRYKDARYVNFKGLFIQISKTLPKLFKEPNNLESKINIFKLANSVHGKLNKEINLNDLIENDNNFMEAVIAYIFTNIEPFTDFESLSNN